VEVEGPWESDSRPAPPTPRRSKNPGGTPQPGSSNAFLAVDRAAVRGLKTAST
jgi:hypothetical protein